MNRNREREKERELDAEVVRTGDRMRIMETKLVFHFAENRWASLWSGERSGWSTEPRDSLISERKSIFRGAQGSRKVRLARSQRAPITKASKVTSVKQKPKLQSLVEHAKCKLVERINIFPSIFEFSILQFSAMRKKKTKTLVLCI